MKSRELQRQIQNLRSKKLINAKPARKEEQVFEVEKTSSGAIRISSPSLVPNLSSSPSESDSKVSFIKASSTVKILSPVKTITAPVRTIKPVKKSGGCGCSRRKK